MTSGPNLMPWLSVAGFVVAPFAASLTAVAPAPNRILFITPFAALVSIYGIRKVLSWMQRGPAL
jgi:hypothetical protein